MKLVDLNPRWQTIYGEGSSRVGVNFECPCAECAAKPSPRDGFDARERAGETKYIIAVPFKLAVDGNAHRADGWERTGETFETLTLTPSIQSYDFNRQPHWHGFITNGQVVPA